MSDSAVIKLLLIIEQQLDWGDAANWQSKDFENLNELIFEKTKVSLSASTLRRVWGRVEYNHYPSGTTLDTLSRFAGYENWRNFLKQSKKSIPEAVATVASSPNPPVTRSKISWVISVLLIICLAAFFSFHKKEVPVKPEKYSFTSRKVTRGIPNSVIFDYDAKAALPTDSIFVQQSWDEGTRTAVDKNLHQYTSVYYRPGVYHAKLVVNNNVVKEHLLTIPTTGWLGLIANQPIPDYVDPKIFLSKEMMQLPVDVIKAKHIAFEPQPPAVEYYNVGDFEPVSLKDFSFDTEVKNDYHDGAAACQFMSIILFTDNVPVIVQLSAKGCVSDLRLLNGRFFVSGKNTDLSGFGADLSQWVKVSCRSVAGKIQYLVNDKLVYESELPLYNENIVGIGYNFQGTGSVKGINLTNHTKTVFKEF